MVDSLWAPPNGRATPLYYCICASPEALKSGLLRLASLLLFESIDELLHVFCCRQTVGVDFGVKQVKIPETDCIVELFLFDCPGQGVFNKLQQVGVDECA